MRNLLDMPWQDFNAALKDSTEIELLGLLEKEKKTRRRLAYMLRLYGRYSRLRTQRERYDLLVVGSIRKTA